MQGSQTPHTRFIGGYNGESSALTKGAPVSIDLTAADGMTVKSPVTANLNGRVGIASYAAPAATWFPILVEGLCSYALVIGHASLDGTAIELLNVTNGNAYLSYTSTWARDVLAVALEGYTTTTAAAAKSVWVIGP